jgi:CTP:molybdopterin cytidylyltransferase MocA
MVVAVTAVVAAARARQILAVVAGVETAELPSTTAEQVAQALSSSVTLAHNEARAEQSHLLVAIPSTPSLRPALTRHKEKTWRILQK